MVATVGERLSGPDRNSLQLNVHCLTRVVSLSEQFHDEILRKIALRHVTANIWQVPWLLIDICYRLKRARNEEDVNSSGQDVPMVFEFSHEAAQIVPTVDLAVLQEHDAVSVSRDDITENLISSIYGGDDADQLSVGDNRQSTDLVLQHQADRHLRAAACAAARRERDRKLV